MDDGKWVTLKDGRRVKITNKYMNDFIRDKGKAKVTKELSDLKDKEIKGDLKEKTGKDKETYFELENGEKVTFLDKKTYNQMKDYFYSSLTEKERKAIELYVDDPDFIYEGRVGPWVVKDDKLRETFEDIVKNKAIPLPQDTLLYRRTREGWIDLKDDFSRDGYTSTCAYDTLPRTMPSGFSFGSTELYILVPKGTKVLPIEKVAVENKMNTDTDKRIYTRQHEILLPRKTNYKVIQDKSTITKDYGYHGRYVDKETKFVVALTDDKKTNKKFNYYEINYNDDGLAEYVYRRGPKNYWGYYNVIEVKETIDWDNVKSRSDIKYKVKELELRKDDKTYKTLEEAEKRVKEIFKETQSKARKY